MKTTLSICLFAVVLNLQGQVFQWAKKVGGSSNDRNFAVAVDPGGNIYSAGAHGAKVFVAKLDSNGVLKWLKSFGIASTDIFDIAIDNAGNTYATGSFSGTTDFDPDLSAIHNLSSKGGRDAFVHKLDSSGNFVWVRNFGGSNTACEGFSIEIDPRNQNIVTTGYFFGDSADFDPELGEFKMKAFGNDDVFISKLDPAGNFVSAVGLGRLGQERSFDIGIDTTGSTYTIGVFHGNVDFDPGSGFNFLSSNGLGDAFISKLDSNGGFVWAKTFGGPGDEQAHALALDDSGNVFTMGIFTGTVDFDPGPGVFSLTSTAMRAVYINKLDPSGGFLWAKKLELPINFSTVPLPQYSLATDSLANVYTTGSFTGITDFDPGPGIYNMSTVSGSNASFVLKLDPTGDFIWAKSMKPTTAIGNSKGEGVILDGAGNIYSVGTFSGSVDFDGGLGQFLLSAGGADAYFHKMAPCASLVTTLSVSGCDSVASPSGKFIWTTSGTYLDTLTTSDGCDSVLNISLTLNKSKEDSISVSACEKFFWQADSNFYGSSGVYSASLNTANGCDSTVTLNLNIDTVDATVTNNDPVLIANNSSATYQWISCDNNYAIIPGAVSQMFTPSDNGLYAVVVTENGCTDTSSCYLLQTVGDIENPLKQNYELYPNPTDGKVYIKLDRTYSAISVNMKAANGKVFFERSTGGVNFFELNTPEEPGLYFIEILTGKGKVTFKVIRQ